MQLLHHSFDQSGTNFFATDFIDLIRRRRGE